MVFPAFMAANIVPRTPASVDFYTPEQYRPEESVGYLMKRVMLSIVQQADRRLGRLDLTSAQWVPLMRLKIVGRATVAELARWVSIDAGAMTRLLDRLEKKGLCKRERSTEDRRVVQVVLTPEGESAISAVPGVLSEVLNAHLAGFTNAEWRALRKFLERMAKNGDALRDNV